jgi:hypothetical protein
MAPVFWILCVAACIDFIIFTNMSSIHGSYLIWQPPRSLFLRVVSNFSKLQLPVATQNWRWGLGFVSLFVKLTL